MLTTIIFYNKIKYLLKFIVPNSELFVCIISFNYWISYFIKLSVFKCQILKQWGCMVHTYIYAHVHIHIQTSMAHNTQKKNAI